MAIPASRKTYWVLSMYGKEKRAVLKGFGYLHPSRISQQDAFKQVKIDHFHNYVMQSWKAMQTIKNESSNVKNCQLTGTTSKTNQICVRSDYLSTLFSNRSIFMEELKSAS